jgi:hypothetical protein
MRGILSLLERIKDVEVVQEPSTAIGKTEIGKASGETSLQILTPGGSKATIAPESNHSQRRSRKAQQH